MVVKYCDCHQQARLTAFREYSFASLFEVIEESLRSFSCNYVTQLNMSFHAVRMSPFE